jgi:hypothetical protein
MPRALNSTWHLSPELVRGVFEWLRGAPKLGDYSDLCTCMLVCKQWKVGLYLLGDTYSSNDVMHSYRLSEKRSFTNMSRLRRETSCALSSSALLKAATYTAVLPGHLCGA